MPLKLDRIVHFSTFQVTSQVFHVTRYSFAVVNIKPLLPGHTLVCPLRVVPRLADLSQEEISDLFLTVQRVGKTLTRAFAADALNIGLQDGVAAGQSVPHVHAHIIPRHGKDLDHKGADAIHEMIEEHEGELQKTFTSQRQEWPQDSARKPRTREEMEKEAAWLADEMVKEHTSSAL